MKVDVAALIKEALKARKQAYAPYSGFMVGAALLTAEGRIYVGCNIENAAYSPTLCAERTAFAQAVLKGERHFLAIAIVGWPSDEPPDFAYPCGVCRQVMSEFCDPSVFQIYIAQSEQDYRRHSLAELLPHSFRI